MSHTPHELHQEFPQKADKIHDLKTTDRHFSRLADIYYGLNKQIHRAETDIEPMDDFHLEHLKKRRLSLLDEINAILNGP